MFISFTQRNRRVRGQEQELLCKRNLDNIAILQLNLPGDRVAIAVRPVLTAQVLQHYSLSHWGDSSMKTRDHPIRDDHLACRFTSD